MTRPPTVRLIHADEATQPDPQALYPAELVEVRVNPAPPKRRNLVHAIIWALALAAVAAGVVAMGGIAPGWWA